MTRLPTPGGDAGNWGSILNEYLSAVHNTDGSLKTGVVAGSNLVDGSITTDKLADAAITPAKLASSVQTTLSSVVTTSTVGAAGGIASLDSSGKVPASQLPEASGGTTPAATASVSGTIRLTGDLGGSATSPSVVKLNGVSLTGTPSAGQALVATSSTAAGWQVVSGGLAPGSTLWSTDSDPATTTATQASVEDGDMWVDRTTDPFHIRVRVNGAWISIANASKPAPATTTAPLASSTPPAVTDTAVTLHWTAPSQVAGTLNGYNVYEGSSTTPLNSSLIPAGTTSYTTTAALTPGTEYSFVIKAVSTPSGGSQTESAGLTISATTSGSVVVPLPAPTGVSATAGNAAATVSFSLVSEATSYTVTSNPGGITKIGSTSPITVDGLANGTSYSFTVSATDGTRTSAESAPSGSVVPSGGGSAALNKVAIIGDSLTEQGGSASNIVMQAFKDAGWTEAWYYAKGGKEFTAADGNGKTTMQNIDDCRAQFGEPDLWVIALSTNDYFRTVNNGRTVNQVKADLQTVLNKLGASAKVVWVNIGFGYEDTGSANLNTSLETDISARSGSATIDWHEYSRPIVNNMTYWNNDKVHMTSSGYAMRNTYVAQQSVAAYEAMTGA